MPQCFFLKFFFLSYAKAIFFFYFVSFFFFSRQSFCGRLSRNLSLEKGIAYFVYKSACRGYGMVRVIIKVEDTRSYSESKVAEECINAEECSSTRVSQTLPIPPLSLLTDDPYFIEAMQNHRGIDEEISLRLFVSILTRAALLRCNPLLHRRLSITDGYTSIEQTLSQLLLSSGNPLPITSCQPVVTDAVLMNEEEESTFHFLNEGLVLPAENYDVAFQGAFLLQLSKAAYAHLMSYPESRNAFPHDISSPECTVFRFCTQLFRHMYFSIPESLAFSTRRFSLLASCGDARSELVSFVSHLSMRFDPMGDLKEQDLRANIEGWMWYDGYFYTHSKLGAQSCSHPRTLSDLAERTGRSVRDEDGRIWCTRGESGVGIAAEAHAGCCPPKHFSKTPPGAGDLLRELPPWDESSEWCTLCARGSHFSTSRRNACEKRKYFRSSTNPLGAQPHHCRACGKMVCTDCLGQQLCFDPSFASRRDPIKEDDARLGRKLCVQCEELYLESCQQHFLIGLFVHAGLSLCEVALCRAVPVLRDAADWCLTAYRCVLHTTEGSFTGFPTPLGLLLCNSIDDILNDKKASLTNGKETEPFPHREPLLLLLRYLSERGLWESMEMQRVLNVLKRLTHCWTINEETICSPLDKEEAFLHKHFTLLCSKACFKMKNVYFFVRCIEFLLPGLKSAAVHDSIELIMRQGLEAFFPLPYCGFSSPSRLSGQLFTEDTATSNSYPEGHEASHESKQLHVHGQQSFFLDCHREAEKEYLMLTLFQLFLRSHRLNLGDAQLFEVLLLPMCIRSKRCAVALLCSLISLSSSEPLISGTFGVSFEVNYQNEKKFITAGSPFQNRYVELILAHLDPVWRKQLEGFIDFYFSWVSFCTNPSSQKKTANLSELFSRWVPEYCAGNALGRKAPRLAKKERVHGGSVEYLDLPYPIPNPFAPHVLFRSVARQGKTISGSSTGAMWMHFCTLHAEDLTRWKSIESVDAKRSMEKAVIYDILFKASSVEKDQFMCLSVRLLQSILAEKINECDKNRLHLAGIPALSKHGGSHVPAGLVLPSYSALPLPGGTGLVERVEGRTIGEIKSIEQYLHQLNQQSIETYRKSATFFIVLNYLFAIGDRHADNVMVSSDGALFHLDFGYVLSEKTVMEKVSGVAIRIDDNILNPIRQEIVSGEAAGSLSFAFEGKAEAISGDRQQEDCPIGSLGVAGSCTELDAVEAFLDNAASWYLHSLPHADLFYCLWRGCSSLTVLKQPTTSPTVPLLQSKASVSQDVPTLQNITMPFSLFGLSSVHEVANWSSYATFARHSDIFNRLCDRLSNSNDLRMKFIRTMQCSINAYRLTDKTRNALLSIQVLPYALRKTASHVSKFLRWEH